MPRRCNLHVTRWHEVRKGKNNTIILQVDSITSSILYEDSAQWLEAFRLNMFPALEEEEVIPDLPSIEEQLFSSHGL